MTKGLGFAEIFGSLLLLLIMIGANYYQQVQITNLNPMVRQNQQMNSQMQLMRFFPILFGLICIRLPSGLVLYYAVSALFRVGQQWMMYHYDPKVIALVAKDDRGHRGYGSAPRRLIDENLNPQNQRPSCKGSARGPATGQPPSNEPAGRPGQSTAETVAGQDAAAKSPPKRFRQAKTGRP